MSKSRKSAIVAIAFAINLVPFFVAAQTKKTTRKGEFYFSWGYNKEWYTKSNVHISQPELGNKYTFKSVRAHDNPGWDKGIFDRAMTIPQYNYRLGYFFNKEKGLAIEINFDHTKYIIDHQQIRTKGTMGGKPIDSSVNWHEDQGFYYFLNNGANFLLFNIVKRWEMYEHPNEKVKLDFLGKAGIGPVIPHVENSLFGQKNEPDFQIGGWNVGVEGALRATFFKYVYLEFASKLDYARYAHLHIYKGRARQSFGTFEMILNLGVTLPTGKKVEVSQ